MVADGGLGEPVRCGGAASSDLHALWLYILASRLSIRMGNP